jgi:hypothetical protein
MLGKKLLTIKSTRVHCFPYYHLSYIKNPESIESTTKTNNIALYQPIQLFGKH